MEWLVIPFTDRAQDGIVLLSFLGLVGAGLAWVYRRVIRPVHVMVARILELTEYELKPNGGGSLVDRVAKIAANHSDSLRQIAANHADAQKHWETLEANDMAIVKRLEKIEAATANPKDVPDVH